MHISQRYYNVIITLLESITIIYPFHNVMITLCVCWDIGGGIMVWGGITAHGKTDLVIVDGNLNSRRYIDEILRPVVVPYVQNMGQGALFQDDNARPHRARIVDAYLQQEQITRVEWPACSPDLNHIEHDWDQLGRTVQTRLNVDSTRADLRRFLLEEWDRLPQNNIQRLIHSMRRRCAECISAGGGPTHYWCTCTVAIQLMCSPVWVF